MSSICRRAQQRFRPFLLLLVAHDFPAEQECVEKELPRGTYDKSVDVVVTDKYIIQNINKE